VTGSEVAAALARKAIAAIVKVVVRVMLGLDFYATASLPLSRSRLRANDCGECRNMPP
jgi:hypothetical protein